MRMAQCAHFKRSESSLRQYAGKSPQIVLRELLDFSLRNVTTPNGPIAGGETGYWTARVHANGLLRASNLSSTSAT